SSIDWESLKGINTLVFLMAVSNRQEIAKRLISVGREPKEPVAFIERGTTKEQKVVITSLKELSENPPEVRPPAVMVVGEVVRLRGSIAQMIRVICNGYINPLLCVL
ncbi:MAG: SAM-dependent methyltransferase, partial [Hydrogenobacter sp.]